MHGTHFMTAGHKSEQITKIMIFGSMRDRLAMVTNVADVITPTCSERALWL